MNIWQQLHKPFFVLAPMEEVTDVVFREIVTIAGKPDVFFTEFTNVEGMMSKGRSKIEHRLQFTPEQRPVIAQIWGAVPDNYTKTAELIVEMGFDGIDINMGCPERGIVKRGECSGLINFPEKAAEIIAATKKGAGNLPVSVKTRIGFNSIVTERWIPFLLDQEIAALTIHARTSREMSKVPAHWEEFGKVVDFRNKITPETPIIANGDIKTREQGLEMVQKYGVDGIMIGRGIFENTWVFNKDKKPEDITLSDRVHLLLQHIDLFEQTWGNTKNFNILKKFVKAYIVGIPNAAEMRQGLMESTTIEELRERTKELINS